jgi:hypothetical protein
MRQQETVPPDTPPLAQLKTLPSTAHIAFQYVPSR